MNKRKRIISLFTAIIIMVVVCETRLTTVKAINSNPSHFYFQHVSGAPSSGDNIHVITVNGNECDLTISSIHNYKVVVTFPGNSQITIYSTGSYHITSTPYGSYISSSILIYFFPIDKNLSSYCRGFVTTT